MLAVPLVPEVTLMSLETNRRHGSEENDGIEIRRWIRNRNLAAAAHRATQQDAVEAVRLRHPAQARSRKATVEK